MHRVNVQFNDSEDTEELSQDDVDHSDEYLESDADEVQPRVLNAMTQTPKTNNTISSINLQLPSRLVLLGPSQSGKTTIIRHIIKHLKSQFNICSIWWFGSSANEETWLSPKFRYDRISKTKIDAIRVLMRKPAFKSTHSIIVLDDVISEKFHRERWWSDFIATSRHDNITVLIGMQYLKSLSPQIRDNVQQYIICSLNNGTCDALHSLSNTPDKYAFRKQLTTAKKGSPILFNTVPGEKEIQHLTIAPLEAKDMK